MVSCAGQRAGFQSQWQWLCSDFLPLMTLHLYLCAEGMAPPSLPCSSLEP